MNWSLSLPMVLVALAFGYLLGSIPFGLILTRLAGLGDIRAIGSGNIGATNVLRTGNKKLAAATLLFDALKGTVAVLLAGWFAGAEAGIVAGLGAFLGHLFPVWLKFKGGKGVATYIGVLLGLWWPAAVAFCLIWLAVAFAFKISSLSAFVASAVVPVLIVAAAMALGIGDIRLALVGVVLSALLWWKHRANLQRLIAGTEPRIGK
ncbi:MAG: glycerol-3-phosphate 1-O-acyltransferase PlsY [Hyphomicrobiaceae bacterium]|nr:glycerol-3-phosphate 1-O-acyltransferase PlsY [Hyphomicrobiaceae bacterium]